MSGTQQVALLATGVIWTRWCLIIKPKNYFLASVNFFLGVVAGYQVLRIYSYQKEQGYSTGQSIINLLQAKNEKKVGDQTEKPQLAIPVAAAVVPVQEK